jgi:hypothetical protein
LAFLRRIDPVSPIFFKAWAAATHPGLSGRDELRKTQLRPKRERASSAKQDHTRTRTFSWSWSTAITCYMTGLWVFTQIKSFIRPTYLSSLICQMVYDFFVGN